jgi:hypothetical protein
VLEPAVRIIPAHRGCFDPFQTIQHFQEELPSEGIDRERRRRRVMGVSAARSTRQIGIQYLTASSHSKTTTTTIEVTERRRKIDSTVVCICVAILRSLPAGSLRGRRGSGARER